MLDTIAALVLFMTQVQAQGQNPEWAWPVGWSYAFTVQTTLKDAQLEAARAPDWAFVHNPDGTVLRANKYSVFLVKVR